MITIIRPLARGAINLHFVRYECNFRIAQVFVIVKLSKKITKKFCCKFCLLNYFFFLKKQTEYSCDKYVGCAGYCQGMKHCWIVVAVGAIEKYQG